MVSDLKSVEESQYEQVLNIIFVFHFKSYLFAFLHSEFFQQIFVAFTVSQI
jgi:hypothetical protein